MNRHRVIVIAALGAAAAGCKSTPAEHLAARAARESLVPVRPGPPFWNGHARQFIHAPSFDFPTTPGATAYRFTVIGSDGRAREFTADTPTATLAPIWRDLPPGPTTVRVETVNGQLVGTRTFHRAAPFADPYDKPVLPYAESARLALTTVLREPFVQSWRTAGHPDPGYPLYRYSSKILGSLMSGCSLYARLSPPPGDAADAIAIARAAGDYLLSISAPAGTPLEFLPPTYHDAKPTERENDAWTMMMTPAEAAQGYLDLYDVTHDVRYLDAADRIATTYARLQSPAGTWPLKLDNQTGKVVADIDLVPSVVISFLDRLATRYDRPAHLKTRDRALAWMSENPMRTFDWRAQFDDAKVRGPYENLAKHEACEFAGYLFRHLIIDRNDPKPLAAATDVLRFAEDQFVTWSHPPDLPSRAKNLAPRLWITPCSTEQYAMFEPISGSSAFMIVAYLRAYDATHDALHLAKARALGDALTRAQQLHHGRYPTRMVPEDLAYWINSTVNTARAMADLATYDGK